jgi:ribonuclease P protein component
MLTIKSPSEMERVFRVSRRGSHSLLIVLISETPDGRDPGGRVAFIAGKKLGGAVIRNRSKRVMREAVRRTGGPWAGHDVVLIARAGTREAPPEQMDGALVRLLHKTRVLT